MIIKKLNAAASIGSFMWLTTMTCANIVPVVQDTSITIILGDLFFPGTVFGPSTKKDTGYISLSTLP